MLKMFNWFKNLFGGSKQGANSSGYYYVVSTRGKEYIRCDTKEKAEKQIRDLFNNTDIENQLKYGNNSFAMRNTSVHTRWNNFRTNCKITRYCGSCGLSGSGCGQC